MSNIKKICLAIIIGFSAFGVWGSAIFFFIDIPKSVLTAISSLVGIIGTVASVVLSVIAMIYSNKSSKEAEESLNAIERHYNTFCTEIRDKEIRDNLGKNSVENIMNKPQESGIDVVRLI